MTSFPIGSAKKAVEAFASASGQILRAEGRPPPRKTNWAKKLLQSLIHAALAAGIVCWSLRGYVDQLNTRLDQQDERRESLEKTVTGRLDDIKSDVNRLDGRLDQVLDGKR